MPCLFSINFPANLVDPRHPAEVQGNSKVLVTPKIQTPVTI
jgi:hypothetical protein